MSHPFKSEAMTGQDRAASRYSFQPNAAPQSALVDAAHVESRGERAEDNFTASPARQISETGKVRK
jgi:hypothetical protein